MERSLLLGSRPALWQLCNIGGDPARFVRGQHLGLVRHLLVFMNIDPRDRLALGVAFQAGVGIR